CRRCSFPHRRPTPRRSASAPPSARATGCSWPGPRPSTRRARWSAATTPRRRRGRRCARSRRPSRPRAPRSRTWSSRASTSRTRRAGRRWAGRTPRCSATSVPSPRWSAWRPCSTRGCWWRSRRRRTSGP
ncbi:MAG: hypothetical protein AVDCRST_MAG13-48, partial [uncultured Solirubrobacteraceae bacterium]